jgi:hypothetical protein
MYEIFSLKVFTSDKRGGLKVASFNRVRSFSRKSRAFSGKSRACLEKALLFLSWSSFSHLKKK